MKLVSLLDLLLNKLPVIKLLNGKKTIIAAALVAASEVLKQVAPFLPAAQQATALLAVETLVQLAAYIGAVGLVGKAVK